MFHFPTLFSLECSFDIYFLPIFTLYIFTLFSLSCITTVFLLAVLHSHCNHAQSHWQSSLILFYGWMNWIYGGRMILLDLLLRSAGTSTDPTIRLKDFVAPRPRLSYVLYQCLLHPPLSEMQEADWEDGKLDTSAAVKVSWVLGCMSPSIITTLSHSTWPYLGKLSQSLLFKKERSEKDHQDDEYVGGLNV